MTALTAQPVAPAVFRDAISHHAAGVAVVTTAGADGPAGVTVSSLASHSVDPPSLSCNLGVESATLAAIRWRRRFAVHLLADTQAELAAHFAGRAPERFTGTTWTWWEDLPALPDVVTSLACDLLTEVVVGDHAIILGTVSAATTSPARLPLVHQRRDFHRLG